MERVKIFWDPNGFELDSLGANAYLRATDGDTPYVSVSIRMLSIDTPEVHYPGNSKPSRLDESLAQLAEWIQAGQAPIQDDLAAHFQPRLATGKAGTLQEEQGNLATDAFHALLEEYLTRPSGRKRRVFLRAADEHFDAYGRLLAYMAPSYSSKELQEMPRDKRYTFNLLMVENGWAAPFMIYPSIPSYPDLVRFQKSAKVAVEECKGAWADPLTLTGYEFRSCVKLYDVTKKLVAGQKVSSRDRYDWITRFCADMTSNEVFYPQDYVKVAPYNRIFLWSGDVPEAVGKMNLLPPG